MKTERRSAKTKESKKLTLKDRLSRLSFRRACQLLGPQGEDWIRQGAKHLDGLRSDGSPGRRLPGLLQLWSHI